MLCLGVSKRAAKAQIKFIWESLSAIDRPLVSEGARDPLGNTRQRLFCCERRQRHKRSSEFALDVFLRTSSRWFSTISIGKNSPAIHRNFTVFNRADRYHLWSVDNDAHL
jgi:hypothetical protein